MTTNSFETVNITIFNRTFSLKTPTDKADTLRQSARYLHDNMKEISQSTGKNDFEALVVACALNLIAEFQDHAQTCEAKPMNDETMVAAGIALEHPRLTNEGLTDSAIFEQMLQKIRQALA